MKTSFSIFLILIFSVSANALFAQRKKKERDFKKENADFTGKPGDNYTYISGRSVFNPKTGKYEPIEGEWKKQPEEYSYDPKKWAKPKHKKAVYGKNPIRRLFKIKPKSPKPDETAPSEKKEEKPFTTGEEKKE